MKTLTTLLLILPALASAQNPYWLKKENPESLPISVFSESDCLLSTEEVKKETENVLIRSRIKPTSGGGAFGDRPYLQVHVRCLELPESKSMVAAMVSIEFVDLIDLNNPYNEKRPLDAKSNPRLVRHGDSPHEGYLLMADKDYLKSTVRDAVEDFMAGYIEANFDLGEDDD